MKKPLFVINRDNILMNNTFEHRNYYIFNVIVNTVDNYTNATHLCNSFDKDINKWLDLHNTRILLQMIINKSDNNIPILYSIDNRKIKKYNGIYVNDLVLHNLCYWLSIDYRYIISNELLKTNNEELENRCKKAESENIKLKEELIETNEKLNETFNIITILQRDLDNNYKELDETKSKFRAFLDKIDTKMSDKFTNLIYDLKKVIENHKLYDIALLKHKKRKPEYKYYIIKGMTNYVNNKTKKMSKDYDEILRINNINNNNIDIFKVLKEKLDSKVTFYNNNNINLNKITEAEFIKIINNVYEN